MKISLKLPWHLGKK